MVLAAEKRSVAVVGSGPAALMAADVLSGTGARVTLFEKRKSAGRKLLIAGSSGLNIGNELGLHDFVRMYTGPRELWEQTFARFFTPDWIGFIERELGIPTFLGTSGRYFVEDMKAARMLSLWVERLRARGVEFRFSEELTGFEPGVTLTFASGTRWTGSAAILALGGGSYEPDETPLRWPALFRDRGITFSEFVSSNCGFEVAWPAGFLQEAEGLPLKNVVLHTSRGARKGDAMVTRYGIEGTPVYAAGESGVVELDLKPDLSAEHLRSRLLEIRENLSPIRRVKRALKLCDASQALLFHCTPREVLADLDVLCARIKRFPLTLGARRPLTEAISSSGGVSLTEIDAQFMLKRVPGVYCVGEMLDWDTVTGGFLIQACVSQGFCVARDILQ